MDCIRVFIVHEDRPTADLTASMLAKSHGLRVSGHCSSALEAQARLGKGVCDIVLVSATLPNDGSHKLIRTIRSTCAPTKVLATGLPPKPEVLMRFIAAGVNGYTLEDENLHDLHDHIYCIHAGRPAVTAAVAATMMVHLAKLSKITSRFNRRPEAYADLTAREHEVLGMLGQDVSNQGIAEKLVIGRGTVKNHVHTVLKKLNLHSRKDVAGYLSLVNSNSSSVQTTYKSALYS